MFVCARRSALVPRPMGRLRPATIASAAVALGATVASDCLLQPFFQGSPLQRGVGAVMAASFGVAGTHWALTREPTAQSALRGSATTGAVVLTWFMFCDRLAALHTAGPGESFMLLALPMLLVVIAAVGAMAGTLFGLTAMAVLEPVERARRGASFDAPERVLLPASVWLSTWGLVLVALPFPRSLAPLAVVLLGLAGLVVVVLRDFARLRFLTALYFGVEPGWMLAPAAPSPSPASIPTYGPYPESTLDGQLVPRTPLLGPYRDPAPEAAAARLPLDPERGTSPLVRRIAWCTALGALVATVAAARLDLAPFGW
jgi:hypothetical protein